LLVAKDPLRFIIRAARDCRGGFSIIVYAPRGCVNVGRQSNPASNGDEFTVSLWMRGRAVGAKGKVTIEFKDQKMWTDPLDTHTVTKTLTTDWRQYCVTRTAPTDSPRPVYQIKLILQAGPSDAVCFDDVRMTRKTR